MPFDGNFNIYITLQPNTEAKLEILPVSTLKQNNQLKEMKVQLNELLILGRYEKYLLFTELCLKNMDLSKLAHILIYKYSLNDLASSKLIQF